VLRTERTRHNMDEFVSTRVHTGNDIVRARRYVILISDEHGFALKKQTALRPSTEKKKNLILIKVIEMRCIAIKS
jgi:hypothetical protein